MNDTLLTIIKQIIRSRLKYMEEIYYYSEMLKDLSHDKGNKQTKEATASELLHTIDLSRKNEISIWDEACKSAAIIAHGDEKEYEITLNALEEIINEKTEEFLSCKYY